MYHNGKWTDELTGKLIDTTEYKVDVEFKTLNAGIIK
jgi:hypothetical protein